MSEIMHFLKSSNDFENKLSANNNVIKEQINKIATIATKYENTVNMLMQTMSNIHGNNAVSIYSVLDNLSLSLRTEKEMSMARISVNTRFVPFIYKYPCQDGIIARIFEISNHMHNLYFLASNIGFVCPELLDYIYGIFKKFEISLDDLQALIQKLNIMKIQDESLLRSVLYSDNSSIEDEIHSEE